MPRKLLIRTSEYPYHINARANNKEWFHLDKHQCWDIFCYYLQESQKRFNIDIHAFVMMSNHIHLMASTPDENIDKVMHYFMMMTSRTIGQQSGRMNRLWGTRYYWSLIDRPEYYAHAYKYLYSNPLRACIAHSINDYKWSLFKENNYKKFKGLFVKQRPGFDLYIPDSSRELSSWINRSEDLFYVDQIRKALKKTTFKFGKTTEAILKNKCKLEEDQIYENFKNYLPKIKN